jgi:hypothetical protein
MSSLKQSSIDLLKAFIDQSFQHRYAILVLFLFAQFILYTSDGLWNGDFWEHSAVVRELMTHPMAPRHPQLVVDATHAFFSPYALLVGVVGRLLGLSSIEALALFGAINLLLLTFGLTRFASTIDRANSSGISFYALLFAMFLWGQEAWLFSGFYNAKIFNSVLPYPSTFALAMSFFVVSLQANEDAKLDILKLMVQVMLSALVLLTHPLTAIFLWVSLFAYVGSNLSKQGRAWISLMLVTLGSLFLSSYWPYFSILQLMLSGGNAYHYANANMYQNVVSSIWPILAVLPLVIWQALVVQNRATCATILMLSVIYIYGFVSEKFAFGRSLSFILLLFNILLAQTVIELEVKLYAKRHLLNFLWRGLTTLILCACACLWMYKSHDRLLTLGNSVFKGRALSSENTYGDLKFLSKYANQEDLILADIEASWIIPTLSGKVVATKHPLAFVPDWFSRKTDVIDFFDINVDAARRIQLLERYNPQYILIRKTDKGTERIIFEQIAKNRWLQLIFETDKFILLRLQPS